MEPKESRKNNVLLEPLGQGMLTVQWDEIETAVRASIGDDAATVANAMAAVRSHDLIVWAVWIPAEGDPPRRMGALLLTKETGDGFSGKRIMCLYAAHGYGLSASQWIETARALEAIARQAGYSRIVALTQNPRISEITYSCGWTNKTITTKEL